MVPGVSFLVYHSISNCTFVPSELGLTVSPQRFEWHIRTLHKYFKVISFEFAIEILKGRRSPISNAVVINFDDGYRDNYEIAFPILRKYDIPATIFLTTGIIGSENRIWLNQLYFDFYYTKVPSITLKNEFGDEYIYSLTTNRKKKRGLFAARELLKNCSGSFRKELLKSLTKQLREDLFESDCGDLKMLSWDQIREMSQHNVTFGAHTVKHLILDNESESVQENEIRLSKETIEDEIHKAVKIFAYPGNAGKGFNSNTKELIKRHGYDACCLFSTGTGFNKVGCDLFELNRTEVLNSSVHLYLELRGIRKRVSRAIMKMRKP